MTALAKTDAKPRLLIADDDPAIVSFLVKRCTNLGFEVDIAKNGLQMLIKARQTAPDVIIVDVNMPELDGVTASVRLLDPNSKPVDVIVVSGNITPGMVERCEAMGLFYGRKGPDFWKSIEDALLEIFPEMESAIAKDRDRPARAAPAIPDRPRVLVVDDDPAVGTFIASRLNKYGVDTLYASDAQQAARIAARQKPSVVVSDFDMPEGDAQHLLNLLRQNPASQDIPVIVLSGKNIDEQTEKSLMREVRGRAGATRIVRKSFDIRELFGALEQFCAFNKAGEN